MKRHFGSHSKNYSWKEAVLTGDHNENNAFYDSYTYMEKQVWASKIPNYPLDKRIYYRLIFKY
jgi:uncharacterized secreted protein with C-terminal beta-propeller domain